MGLEKPNYTQIPNVFFDAMPSMKEAELRVLLAVARQTFGYHRESDYLSITALCKLTGLSRRGVAHGIKDAVARGWLSEMGTGKRGMRRWKLALYNEVPQSEEPTIAPSAIVPLHEVPQSPPTTIARSRTTKETKETQGKKATLPANYAAMQNSLNPALLPYLTAWQQSAANNGVEPPIPSGQRSKMLEDAQTLVDMGCTSEDWGKYISERKKSKKSTVWTFAMGDVHEYIGRAKLRVVPKNQTTPEQDDAYRAILAEARAEREAELKERRSCPAS